MLLPETLRHLKQHVENTLPERLHALAYWAASSFLMALDFSIPAPDSIGSTEEIVLLCWDQGVHHFEMQIGVYDKSQGYIEYFYYDRTASILSSAHVAEGRMWLEENSIQAPVNAAALAKLAAIYKEDKKA